MTIEAQGTLPAGWYSDPAQSGGDRWWDGTGWTEHLRAPVELPPVAAMPELRPHLMGNVFSPMTAPTPTASVPVVPAPVVAAPAANVQPTPTMPPPAAFAPAAFAPLAPLAPLSTTTTGPVVLAPLAPVGPRPTVPAYDTFELHGSAEQMHFDPEVSNGTALVALLFGAIAIGLAAGATTVLPFPQVWVSVAAVLGVIFGIRALLRVRAQLASNRWAPVIGILLAIVATATVFFGSAVMTLVSSVVPQQSASATAPSVAPLELSAVPEVFPLNATLTAQSKGAQTVATALNRLYANGTTTLADGKAWPTGLRMSGENVLTTNGTRIATLPAGESVTYTLAADGKSYGLAISAGNGSELAHYSSEQNAFSATCAVTDQTCTPSN